MPQPRSKSRDEMTPFARLLWDYIWSQGPGMNMARLARKIGVTQQSLSDWFSKDAIPRPKTLGAIADATGIPLSDLYAAADYPWPATGGGPIPESLDEIASAVERSDELPPDARNEIIRIIRERRQPYSASSQEGASTAQDSHLAKVG